MKLRQNGTVFRVLNWPLWQSAGTANRRISNIEYRMSKEGILSILSKKMERSDSILRHSSFVIRFFRVSFSIRPAIFFWPAAGLTPETFYSLQHVV
jgi:hypothetical protein